MSGAASPIRWLSSETNVTIGPGRYAAGKLSAIRNVLRITDADPVLPVVGPPIEADPHRGME